MVNKLTTYARENMPGACPPWAAARAPSLAAPDGRKRPKKRPNFTQVCLFVCLFFNRKIFFLNLSRLSVCEDRKLR